MAAVGSIGFRPTAEDDELIRAHRRPDESTTDVLRRALRALDRERWDQQARADMERIAASDEDLSDEPDDWFLDEDGEPVDRRGVVVDQRHPPARSATRLAPASLGQTGAIKRSGFAQSPMALRLFCAAPASAPAPTKWPLPDVDLRRRVAEAQRLWADAPEPATGSGAFLLTAVSEVSIQTEADDLTRGVESLLRAERVAGPTPLPSGDRSAPVPPKVARLRAAARRASKR
ncbi:hypothetical protein [Streptomyces salinarius]|uniref:hypothetical protein n=1 Tax=Streptomyces salinarius TaxID=2762598 RepID=UPI0028526EB0|nr:hypothetical protein [Streptomyces salinarius]